MPNCECDFEAKSDAERRTLVAVLTINVVMFLAEFLVGVFADSTGLTADSLDMFADASVYAISLYAVGRDQTIRSRAAIGSGIFQIVLGLGVLLDVCRRFFIGGEPVSIAMMAMGLVALAANATCLSLLAKHRHGDVNLRASWIFSTNDVIANVGVIVSGGLVWLTASRFPDLVIGLVIALLVVRGGARIISEARALNFTPEEPA
jgi:cation diffusion facilitator family transporter